MTTNGVSRSLSWFVVASSTARRAPSPHPRRRPILPRRSPRWWPRRMQAAQAAAQSRPRPGCAAAGRARLAAPAAVRSSTDPAEPTSFEVFGDLLPSLGGGVRQRPRRATGSCTASPGTRCTTTHLGSSTGLRLRWVQPTGLLEVNAKSADLQRSAWSGVSTADFAGVDVDRVASDLADQTRMGPALGRPPAGPLRHGAAADRGRRFRVVPGLERRSARRARGPVRVLGTGRRHQGRASG